MSGIENRKNKRSLKRRIRKLVYAINFYSLLIMLVALMVLFGVTTSFFGEITSQNIAERMTEDFNMILSRAISEKRIDETTLTFEENINTNECEWIFRSLGERYKLSTKQDERYRNFESTNLELLLNNKENIKNNIENVKLVEYRIFNGQTMVYNSQKESDSPFINIDNYGPLMNFLSKEVSVHFQIKNYDLPLTLTVRINPVIIIFGLISLVAAGIIIFFLTLCLARIFARTFSGMIVKPLMDLECKINNLAEGNIEVAMGSELVFKKPIREVESLANSTNKIMSKMSEYVGLLESQKEELEAQNTTLEENSSALTAMNAALANNHSKLKNILDHVEQGLFTFNKNLIINDEYSLECERIFSKPIGHTKLSSLIYESDESMQSFIDDLILKIFSSEDSKRSLYISLLPEEIVIRDKNISISYKIVTDEKNEEIMMIILNDITEKRKLERLMDEERNVLKMVVKSIINRNEFIQLSNEYKSFCEEDLNYLQHSEHDEVLRKIHTFKGNFSQFDMINVVKKLDELENSLYDTSSAGEISRLDGRLLLSWLTDDLDIIEAYTGNDFLKDEEMFYIKKSKLTEIEEKVKKVLPAYECRTVLPLIRSLSYKSVKELMSIYPNYVDKLSQRLEKSIKTLEIIGDEVFIDTNYYSEVSKSLVHIFRNCLDHGIESEDERLEKGKDQSGLIQCNIEDLGDTFRISITDDGRGINVDLLERKCVELNLFSTSELDAMSYKEKLNLIFEQGISTKDCATTISGRGVGMAAVKEAVESSGGTIVINSEKDVYTSFIITLPKIEEKVHSSITPHCFMSEIIKTTKTIVSEQTGIELISEDIKEENIITLNKVTSLINLKGSLNSIVMISANELMAKRLVESFILEKLTEEEKNNYMEDVIGEICNNVLGNTFGAFENNEYVFQISIPAMISNKGAYLKYTNSDILTCNLDYEDFKLSINMLLQQEDLPESLGGI